MNCFNYKKKKNILAFTLIELLLVLFIIIIISALTLFNYNFSNNQTNLLNSQLSLFNNIKLVQSKSLLHSSYNDQLPHYWGINLKSGDNYFTVFADLDGDFLFDSEEVLNKVFFPKDVSFSFIFYNNGAAMANEISILFELGTGQMIVYGPDILNIDFDYYIEIKSQMYNSAKLIKIVVPGEIEMIPCSCNSNNTFCCSFCSQNDPCLSF